MANNTPRIDIDTALFNDAQSQGHYNYVALVTTLSDGSKRSIVIDSNTNQIRVYDTSIRDNTHADSPPPSVMYIDLTNLNSVTIPPKKHD